MGDAKTQKTPELMRKFGEFVHGLRRYYCRDRWKRRYGYRSRRYLRYWISEERGGSRKSPVTAYGVYMEWLQKSKFDPILLLVRKFKELDTLVKLWLII
jgi:leucine dehydrogenase